MEVVQDPGKRVRPAAPGWSLSTHSVRQGIKLADAARCLHTERCQEASRICDAPQTAEHGMHLKF